MNTTGAPVLILVAHADDTEFLCGGTIAKLAQEGRPVTEVIATNNERGSHELAGGELIAQSRAEALEAARLLGKKDVVFLEYSDGMMSDVPLNELRERFMRLIRQVRPRTVFTFDPWAPYEPHPDHRAVAWAAVEAVSFAQNPRFHPEHAEDGLPPHQVAEAYYFAKSPVNVNRIVDVTETMDKKIAALLAHDSQMKLTVDELTLAVRAVGRFEHLLATFDRDNVAGPLEIMVRAWNRDVAAGEAFEYGEAFRYEAADSLLEGITQ